MRKNHSIKILISIVVTFLFFLLGCSTGVEESPDPGLVRVVLQADPTDNSIVITGDTLAVGEFDIFDITIFQGKIYNGDYFAVLFKDTRSYRQEDLIYNIIETTENGQFIPYTIYESYVPPGAYDKVQFGLTANLIKISNFEIPVRLPAGSGLLMDIPVNFTISENQTTVVTLYFSPFKSIERYRDSFNFNRKIEVVSVHQE